MVGYDGDDGIAGMAVMTGWRVMMRDGGDGVIAGYRNGEVDGWQNGETARWQDSGTKIFPCGPLHMRLIIISHP